MDLQTLTKFGQFWDRTNTCCSSVLQLISDIITKLPESGDTSDDITECDVWKDLAEAEG